MSDISTPQPRWCSACGKPLPKPDDGCEICAAASASRADKGAAEERVASDVAPNVASDVASDVASARPKVPLSGLQLGAALGNVREPPAGDAAHTMRLDAITEPEEVEDDETLAPDLEETGDSKVVEERVRRRPGALGARLSRAVPLLVLLTIGLASVVTFGLMRRPTSASAGDLGGASLVVPALPEVAETVDLPATLATIGLSDENKEVVLTLCFQLSDHPTSECRVQYLRDLEEFPARMVEVPALSVDRFEVSNAMWAACEAAGACPARDIEGCAFYSVARGRELRASVPPSMLAPNYPAMCVTFEEAASLCRWRGMRLPSEDEWERVARSGDDRLQPWGRFVMPGLMNWGERILVHFPIPGRVDGFELTAPVDEYRSGASDEGVHNMLGNVAEWVSLSPREGAEETEKVGVRGASYVDGFQNLRVTHRGMLDPGERRTTVGFRCVR